MRLPLAWSDHAFGKLAELMMERIRSGCHTRDGPDRFQRPPLPDDRGVVLESPCHHEEVRTVGERDAQERFRIVKRGLEGDRAHAIKPGGAGSLFDTAPDAGSERAALGVE